jgi:hypothetical protein
MVSEDVRFNVTSIRESLCKGASVRLPVRRVDGGREAKKDQWHNDSHGYLRSKKINKTMASEFKG